MIKRFKNGNLHIRFLADELEDIRRGKFSDTEIFLWNLEEVDTYTLGEQYCISNFDMGITLYSVYCDKVFRFNFRDLDKLNEGKTVILFALDPDTFDRELIENEYGPEPEEPENILKYTA